MVEQVALRVKQKQKFFEEAMKGDHLLVHLDARSDGVQVPPQFAGNPALTLKLSYLFQGKTTCDEHAVSAYLKFSGEYHHCVVPWSAVWGMTASDQKNHIWSEDVPREVVVQLARAKIAEVGKKLLRRGKKESSPVEAAGKEPQSGESQKDEGQKKPRVAHLKRVK